MSRYLAALLIWPVVCLMVGRLPAAEKLTGEKIAINQSELIVHPIRHATLVLQWGGKVIYVDPVGGAEAFKGLPAPDFVLVTDIHRDHFDLKTLSAVVDPRSRTLIFAPKAVWEKLPTETLGLKTQIMKNTETAKSQGLMIVAVPMYNQTPERQKYHPKGRGNGYVLWLIGQGRVYISGDTEDIPEMRKLKDIDVAFVCMNLPYTMDVDAAASAVLDFKPKIVYPYHYRGAGGKFSDLKRFQKLVGEKDGIDVRIRNWYPEERTEK